MTWKLGAELDLAPGSMAFATVAQGYKAGGFFRGPDLLDNAFNPEYLTAFELGVRNRFLNNRLQLNLEAFYWRYRDQQISAIGFTKSGAIAYLTRNAGASNPYGFDADLIWQPNRRDRFGITLSYVRARYRRFDIDFPAALGFALRTGSNCRVPAVPITSPTGSLILPVDCAGAPLPRTPEWSGTVNYEHVFELASGARLTAEANSSFATSRYLGADFFVPEEKDGGYALVNASLTYTPDGGRWSLTAWGRNLTDHPVYSGGITDILNGFGGPATPSFVLGTVGAPRTYGVRATINF